MRALVCALLALATLPASAHEAVAHARAQSVWNGITATACLALAVLYGFGLLRGWRSDGGRRAIRRWQAVAFAAGLAAAAVALLSRLDEWSDVLFSAHMAQHEILMLISAPLMVVGRPSIVLLWALPPSLRERAASVVRNGWIGALWERSTGPATVLVLHTVVLWVWHLPVLFEAALRSESVHIAQHLGFFGTAVLFWWTLIHGRYGRLGYGVGVFYVFGTAMHTQILGALLTFGDRVWYPTHAARTSAAGIRAVQDQQLAGVLMWIPFGMVFLFVVLALFAAWLGEAERRMSFARGDRG
jgi:putative membrane protein